MRVLLVDADSKAGFPNLALMKISAWHKAQGDTIELIRGIPDSRPLVSYDRGYISCIFFQNRKAVLDYAAQLPFPMELGGSGLDLTTELPREIEHIMPDYDLYDIDFSMGFISRGCIRHCGFCVVPEKEGRIRDNASITEFLHPDHEKVMLLDNNFQASPRWCENIRLLIEEGLRVNFNQGLDIRLVTEEFAYLLAQTRYYSWNFKTRGLHFAFDSIDYERAFLRGSQRLMDAGIPARHIMVYVLVGYDSSLEEDLHRVRVIRDLGAVPYIMRYNQSKEEELKDLARWVNRRYYQFIPWGEYLA